MLRLVALAALIGTSAWLRQSTFVPLVGDGSTSYVLCTAAYEWLVLDVVASTILLWALSSAVRWLRGSDPRLFPTSSDVRPLTPLMLAAINLTTIGLLWPPLREWWPPVAYLGDSLFPVAWCAAAALVCVEINAACNQKLRLLWDRLTTRVTGGNRLLIADAIVVGMILVIVIASSPGVRFSSAPVGDEPKYLRYAENWWQGRGMDMDGIEDASARPHHERPQLLLNLEKLVPTVSTDLSQLAADAAFLANRKHWGHQFNRAEYIGNWMLRGPRGGFYQVHAPGISFALMPGYVLDRWLLNTGFSRFADDLFTVNATLLVIFALLAGVLFRIVDSQAGDRVVAAIATMACLTSLPLSAFTFQFYPETLGALLVSVVGYRLLQPGALRVRTAAGLGLALGWLIWLHVRFVPVSAVMFLLLSWTCRRHWQAVATVAISYLAVGGAFCFYAYHVTGSVLPTALYAASPAVPFQMRELPLGLLGTFFDRENGLFAVAPVYLLALPGLAMLARDRPRSAVILLMLEAALIVPVAGQGYETAGTSPLRYLVAAVPLLAIPVAVFLQRARGHVTTLTLSAFVMLVSVDLAVMYNLGNDKTITQTIAHGVAGWDPSLLFPVVRNAVTTSGFDRLALIEWLVISIAAIAAGARQTIGSASSGQRSWLGTAGLCCGALAVAGGVAIASGGPSQERRLLKPPTNALMDCQTGCGRETNRLRIGSIPPDARSR